MEIVYHSRLNYSYTILGGNAKTSPPHVNLTLHISTIQLDCNRFAMTIISLRHRFRLLKM